MAKRKGTSRRIQPRDSRGRFVSTKTPLWVIVLIVVIVLAYAAT
ncbi:hypothetical protein [Streptomyces sp. NPDC058297]